jgi:copper chaperone CopZ
MSKKWAFIFVPALLLVLASACTGKSKKGAEVMEVSGIEISIQGMTCTGCEQTIQTNISKLEGVKSVKASFTDGKALVEFQPSLVDTTMMKEAVTGAGYVVKGFAAVETTSAPQE